MRLRRPVGEEARTVGIVTGGHLLSHFYLLVLPPLFPLVRADLGLTNARLGLLVSVISAATLLQVPFGEFVDRTGAKPVFVAGVGITGLGIALAGLVESYPAILAGVLVSGVGQATFHPADYPLVEAVSDPDRRGRNFSVHTFGGYVGFALAPLVAGGLGSRYGWRAALVVLGAVGLVYAGFAALALSPVYRERIDERATDDATGAGLRERLRSVARPGIRFMFAFFFLATFASKGVQSFTPILAIDGLGLAETAGNTALSGFFAVTAAGILVGGPLADRYDPDRLIPACLTLAALGVWLVASGLVPVGAAALVAVFAVVGGAYGLAFPARDRLVSEFSAEGSTGRSFGLVFTGTAVSGAVGPVLLGAVIDAASAELAFGAVGGSFLAAGAVVLVLRARRAAGAVTPAGAD